MTAKIIDGAAVARRVHTEVAERVKKYTHRTGKVPGLATVLVGDDPASGVYVARKRKLAAEVGIADLHRHLPANATESVIAATLDELGSDDTVSGILLQLPLPGRMDSGQLIERIPASKDVDGLTTTSAGLLARGQAGLRPCTPSGVMRLLSESGIELAGRNAVVVGRSELVGRPMAQLLLQQHATVTIAHSRTRNLADLTRQAEILIAAAGVPGLIGSEHIAAGATVIDVGIHRTDRGIVGDVRFDEATAVAGAITPVPGGVGPMTIAMLLSNTMDAAEACESR
ncbi:bifunctional methylenetetrahydrofolate dehydrogenase/methenyltetrahydrofolate cyclohydrolase FolD [Arthrobacter sp. NPDC056727]|uniref:bifunctional methylenetetrahydrofolate dehydrogenase/methenyltetrahydrofolate cyclohydrolase FolD n=1 Tax=Arthrobacter sp. NPDC056727 TaxID=3345927 RepID=UPI00367147AC